MNKKRLLSMKPLFTCQLELSYFVVKDKLFRRKVSHTGVHAWEAVARSGLLSCCIQCHFDPCSRDIFSSGLNLMWMEFHTRHSSVAVSFVHMYLGELCCSSFWELFSILNRLRFIHCIAGGNWLALFICCFLLHPQEMAELQAMYVRSG